MYVIHIYTYTHTHKYVEKEKGDRERTLRGFGIRSKGVPTETHGRKEGLSAETRDKTQAKPTLLLPDPSF